MRAQTPSALTAPPPPPPALRPHGSHPIPYRCHPLPPPFLPSCSFPVFKKCFEASTVCTNPLRPQPTHRPHHPHRFACLHRSLRGLYALTVFNRPQRFAHTAPTLCPYRSHTHCLHCLQCVPKPPPPSTPPPPSVLRHCALSASPTLPPLYALTVALPEKYPKPKPLPPSPPPHRPQRFAHCPHCMPSPFKVGYTLSAHSPHCPHHPDLGHTVSVLRSFTVFALTALTSPNAQTPPPVFVRRLSTVSIRIHHRIMPSWSWNYRHCWQRTGPAINSLLIPILFFLVTSPDYFQHLLHSLDSHLSAFGVGGTGGSP